MKRLVVLCLLLICGPCGLASAKKSEQSNWYLIKTDSLGSIEWERSLEIEGISFFEALEIQETPDGGYAAVGIVAMERVDSTGDKQYDYDLWAFKSDSSGSPLWHRKYGLDFESDHYIQFEIDPDGEYIIYFPYISYFGWEVRIVNINSGGRVIGNRIFENLSRGAIYPSDDSGYMLIATGPRFKIQLFRLDIQGNVVYEKTIATPPAFENERERLDAEERGKEYSPKFMFQAVDYMPGEGFVVLCSTLRFQRNFVLRFDEDGDTLWTREVGREEDSWVCMSGGGIYFTADKGLIVDSPIPYLNENTGMLSCFDAVALDSLGNTVWAREYDIGFIKPFPRSDGGLMFWGWEKDPILKNSYELLARVDSTGGIICTENLTKDIKEMIQISDGGYVYIATD